MKSLVRYQSCWIALIAVTFVAFAVSRTHADDWPNWRGPNHNDKSAETGLLKTWPEGGPEQVWVNKNAGLGYAGIAIAEDHLYTMGLDGDNEFALCLNANDGQEVWRQTLGPLPEGDANEGGFLRQWGDGPRSTPTVDSDKVYFLGAGGRVSCLAKGDGKQVWSIDMKDFGGAIPTWGYSESPLVDEGKVICTPGGPQGTLLALDKKTGNKIWQSPPLTRALDDGEMTPPASAHYSSILPIDWNNGRQYVQLTAIAVAGFDSDSGEILWQSTWPGRTAVIPSPIFDKGDIYVTSGYGIGSKLIKIGSDGATDVWYTKDMQNHHGSVIQVGDYYYGSSAKAWTCQAKQDGKTVWNDRRIQKGSVTYADGMFYHVQENDGKVLLIEANEKEHAVKGSFVLSPQSEKRLPRGMVWTHPVIANGKLYLRDQDMIYCYNVKAAH